MTKNTIEVPVEDFAFWQAQMAHASAKAENDPDHEGGAIHRAHEQMMAALTDYHTDRSSQSVAEEMTNDSFAELVRSKDWVASDDHIEPHDDEYETFVWWTTESYITNQQVHAVIKDTDVTLGVIDPDAADDFRIAVYHGDW